jgi:hypothetical protein
MRRHVLAQNRLHKCLIVYDGFSIISRGIYHLALANRLRFFAIILILILLLIFILLILILLLFICLLLIFLLSIILVLIGPIPLHIDIALNIDNLWCVLIILDANIHI